MQRDLERERQPEAARDKNGAPLACFSTLHIGMRPLVIDRGDTIKLKVKAESTGKEISIEAARVLCFIADAALPSNVQSYKKGLKVEYVRVPLEVFGDEKEQKLVRNERTSIKKIKYTDHKIEEVKDSELKRMRHQHTIKSVHLYRFDAPSSNPQEVINGSSIPQNQPFHRLGVQILNERGERLFELPGGPSYWVELSMPEDKWSAPIAKKADLKYFDGERDQPMGERTKVCSSVIYLNKGCAYDSLLFSFFLTALE